MIVLNSIILSHHISYNYCLFFYCYCPLCLTKIGKDRKLNYQTISEAWKDKPWWNFVNPTPGYSQPSVTAEIVVKLFTEV